MRATKGLGSRLAPARRLVAPPMLAAVAVAAGIGGAAAALAGGNGGQDRVAPPARAAVAQVAPRDPLAGLRLRPHAVEPAAGDTAGVQPGVPSTAVPKVKGSKTASAPSPGAPSDSQVRGQLGTFKDFLSSSEARALLIHGPRAMLLRNGLAVAPYEAPDVVDEVIQAANAISTTPYVWGGGHGAWRDNGYDCSGSVSFALAAAGLLNSPLTSGQFMRWGRPGPGRWITLFASDGHVFMYVAGLRFDTGGLRVNGSRWQPTPRSTAGFVAVHPPGL